VASKVSSSGSRAYKCKVKAVCANGNWLNTFVSFQLGDSDDMVTRTYQVTGEALLVPRRNSWV